MRQFIYICVIGLLALSCDDGDIFEVELLFDQELDLCIDANEGDYIFFDTKTDPGESLSILFPISGNDDIFSPPNNNYVKTLAINETSVKFNYRTYSGDPENLLCQVIPDPGTTITNDYPAATGADAVFTTTFEDDDNDGVLTEFEGRGEPDEDGLYTSAQDTDGDGIPDYLDEDDDNDNILTINENPDPDADGNPSDAQNTDFDMGFDNSDSIPDYLDSDDDGDGIATINEDEDSNSSLTNDFDEGSQNFLDFNWARYLDPLTTETFTAGTLQDNAYTRTVTINVMIEDANIGIANIDDIEMGNYIFTITLPEN